MYKEDFEFFNELYSDEQADVLGFARAYMRVRELRNDKSLSKSAREHFARLEAKLELQTNPPEEE